jgi:predicted MFS family arabinose efflux permease
MLQRLPGQERAGQDPQAPATRVVRPSAVAPFRTRSFRLQWPADLLTSWALEMEMLILGWYVLAETGSVMMLTVFAALLNIGTLVAPMFGVVGDRISQRNLLSGMRAIYTVLAAVLTTLAFTGALTPTYVLISAGLVGLIRPSDIGVRGALAASTVPHEHLVSAMGISRTTADSARMFGALSGAGIFVAFGMVPSYIAITSFYVLSALLTLCTGPEVQTRQADVALPSPWRDLKEGLAHIVNTPRLHAMMWTAFLVNLAAFPMVSGLMPYVAKDLYGTDQTGLGYLVASLSFGALVGSVVLSTASERMRVERVMIGAIMTWFAMLLVFAHVRSMLGGIVCLFIIGFAQSMSVVSLAVILMRTAAPQFRGRVMGVRMLAIYGHPVGLLIAGALIERIGFTATATTFGVVGILATSAVLLYWRADVLHAPVPTPVRDSTS